MTSFNVPWFRAIYVHNKSYLGPMVNVGPNFGLFFSLILILFQYYVFVYLCVYTLNFIICSWVLIVN